MKALRAYNIEIFKLTNSSHEYQFDIDNVIFTEFENSIVQDSAGTVDVKLNKSNTLIEMVFNIRAKVVLICDRTLETFDFDVNTTQKMIFKYADKWEELSDEIVTIPQDEQRINVAQYIYEFICLEIPLKKIHPKYADEDDEGLVYLSDENQEEETKPIDPRWDKLKDILK